MSRRPTTPLTLTAKVARVLRSVKKLQRKGHNNDDDYDYTRATDVFEAVRDQLFRQDILLLPDEGEPEYVEIQTNGGTIIECHLPVTYTFFASKEDSLPPLRCNGCARDKGDKALPKAQTGSQKAFLKRVGLMAEEIDDPEFEGQAATAETLDDVAPLKGAGRVSRRERPLTAYQIANIREGMAATGKTEAQLSEMVAMCKAATLEEVKQFKFRDLFKWATNGQGTIRAPKPQAVPASQSSLPLGRPPAPIEMKIGNKTVQFEPKDRATFSV